MGFSLGNPATPLKSEAYPNAGPRFGTRPRKNTGGPSSAPWFLRRQGVPGVLMGVFLLCFLFCIVLALGTVVKTESAQQQFPLPPKRSRVNITSQPQPQPERKEDKPSPPRTQNTRRQRQRKKEPSGDEIALAKRVAELENRLLVAKGGQGGGSSSGKSVQVATTVPVVMTGVPETVPPGPIPVFEEFQEVRLLHDIVFGSVVVAKRLARGTITKRRSATEWVVRLQSGMFGKSPVVVSVKAHVWIFFKKCPCAFSLESI